MTGTYTTAPIRTVREDNFFEQRILRREDVQSSRPVGTFSGVSNGTFENTAPQTVPTNTSRRNPFARLENISRQSSPTSSPNPNEVWRNSTVNTSQLRGGTLSHIFLNSLENFYAAAREDGHTYQRKDPTNTKGMDCCTGPWNFLRAFLSPEDWAKLKPLKERAYNMKDANLTKEQRIRGFAGAIGDAGIGTTQKVDQAFVDSLKTKSDEEIKNSLVGRVATITGTNGDHVYVISDAWKDPSTGEIKYRMLGPHIEGAQIQEGGSSGIGTRTKVYSLKDDIKPGAHMHIATLNDDVIQ